MTVRSMGNDTGVSIGMGAQFDQCAEEGIIPNAKDTN